MTLTATVGRPFSHWWNDAFTSGLLEGSDASDTDTILGDLVSSVVEDLDPDATAAESVTLYRYPELTAAICIYREEGELWLQFRVGYLHNAAPAADKKNFASFICKHQHNPFITAGGHRVTFAEFFVNDLDDERHRFGAHFILSDMGVNDTADLLDYLLVRCGVLGRTCSQNRVTVIFFCRFKCHILSWYMLAGTYIQWLWLICTHC